MKIQFPYILDNSNNAIFVKLIIIKEHIYSLVTFIVVKENVVNNGVDLKRFNTLVFPFICWFR